MALRALMHFIVIAATKILDDDVVWFEPELFEKMVKFRVDNPEYFLVSPLVINNALSTYLLQVHNKIKLDKYYMSICGGENYLL